MRPSPFRVRLDREQEMKPRWRAKQAADNLARQSPAWLIARSVVRGRFVPPTYVTRQLVIVTGSQAMRKNASLKERSRWRSALRAYANYIERDEAAMGRLFDRDGKPIEGALRDAVAEWGDDRRFYRLSLNPQHGNEMPDMIAYTKEVMEAYEAHLLTDKERERGVRLDWVGAVHDNTGRAHSHVLLRARVEEHDLYIRPDFLTYGMRSLAREVASREHHLGLRTWDEMVTQPGKDSRGKEALIERGIEAEAARDDMGLEAEAEASL